MSNPGKLNLSRLADKDHTEGQAELLNQLKTSPASDLHNLDPALLARLTAKQRQQLFAQKASNFSSGLSNHRTKKANLNSSHKRPWLIRRFWFRLPVIIRSLFVGAMSSLIIVSGGLVLMANWSILEAKAFRPLTISKNTADWPTCRRLTSSVDGCTYRVSYGITSQNAADRLGMSLEQFFVTNTHLQKQSSLRANDIVIVWRGLLTLKD